MANLAYDIINSCGLQRKVQFSLGSVQGMWIRTCPLFPKPPDLCVVKGWPNPACLGWWWCDKIGGDVTSTLENHIYWTSSIELPESRDVLYNMGSTQVSNNWFLDIKAYGTIICLGCIPMYSTLRLFMQVDHIIWNCTVIAVSISRVLKNRDQLTKELMISILWVTPDSENSCG